MIVRFASLCDYDGCKKRSEEYTSWPSCQMCMLDCCPEHQHPGSKTDADLDTPETCLCLTCGKAES